MKVGWLSFFPWFFLFLGFSVSAHADVVRPALVEITVQADRKVYIEIRASIEAILSGINNRWKNTQDAPRELAESYDVLRVLEPLALKQEFSLFINTFENSISLHAGRRKIALQVIEVKVPPTGYTKVPRNSLIVLTGLLPNRVDEIIWHYPEFYSDSVVRVRQTDEVQQLWHWSAWQWLRDGQTSQPFNLSKIYGQRLVSWNSVVAEYFDIGFDHIIPLGWDHVLFVLGMFLMSAQLRPLLAQVTMFTLAHSLTLILAMFGLISLPASIVEPLIALSIAYVAIENLCSAQLKKRRMILILVFGLLHGLGFADALTGFAMPREDFITALVGFNLGVEAGQIVIILTAYLGLGLWFSAYSWYRSIITIPGSLAIATIALYWFYDRI